MKKPTWGRRRWACLVLAICLAACHGRPAGHYLRILCLGDSLTESRFGSYVKPLRRMLRRHSAAVRLAVAARPGDTSGEYLAFLYKSDLLEREKPDIAILMIGTNDVRIDGDHTELAAFVANLQHLLDRLAHARSHSGAAPKLLLAAVPPIFHLAANTTFDDSSGRRIAAEINPAIRRIAGERRLALVDMEAAFAGRGELLPGVHPNAAGYEKMAEIFFQALLPLLPHR